MLNAERIMTDVGYVVRDWENGRVNPDTAVKKILELTKDNCDHCVYDIQNCRNNHEVNCFSGFSQWLRGEA